MQVSDLESGLLNEDIFMQAGPHVLGYGGLRMFHRNCSTAVVASLFTEPWGLSDRYTKNLILYMLLLRQVCQSSVECYTGSSTCYRTGLSPWMCEEQKPQPSLSQ